MDFFILSTITQPPAAGETATQVTSAGTPAPVGGMGLGFTIIYIIFIVAMIWFLMIRPQKKRDKKLKEMVSNIRAGDSVVTNTGFYGKVVDVTEGCFVIEFGTNRGVRIPVDKSEIAGIRDPNLTVKKYDTPAIAENEEKN